MKSHALNGGEAMRVQWWWCCLLWSGLAAADDLFVETFNGAQSSFSLNTASASSSAGTGADNQWVINAAYTGGSGSLTCFGFPFNYTVPNTPDQPVGITGAPNSAYLHIAANEALADGIQATSQLTADGFCFFGGAKFAAMSSDVVTTSRTQVGLSFWRLMNGSAQNYGEVYYSLDSGATWTKVGGNLSGQAAWTMEVLTLPEWDNQPTLRFGFRFVNNESSSSNDPSFAVDDVRVSAETPNAVFSNGFESN